MHSQPPYNTVRRGSQSKKIINERCCAQTTTHLTDAKVLAVGVVAIVATLAEIREAVRVDFELHSAARTTREPCDKTNKNMVRKSTIARRRRTKSTLSNLALRELHSDQNLRRCRTI